MLALRGTPTGKQEMQVVANCALCMVLCCPCMFLILILISDSLGQSQLIGCLLIGVL